jgi:hypothetical protein
VTCLHDVCTHIDAAHPFTFRLHIYAGVSQCHTMGPALCPLGLPTPCRAAGKAWCTPSSNMCLINHQPTACQGPLHKSIAESQHHHHSARGPQGHPPAQAAQVICIQSQQLLHRYCHCYWGTFGCALPDIKALHNTMSGVYSQSAAVETPSHRLPWSPHCPFMGCGVLACCMLAHALTAKC